MLTGNRDADVAELTRLHHWELSRVEIRVAAGLHALAESARASAAMYLRKAAELMA